jgi:hypothetical protein
LLVHAHRVIANYVGGEVVVPVNVFFYGYCSCRNICEAADAVFYFTELYAVAA